MVVERQYVSHIGTTAAILKDEDGYKLRVVIADRNQGHRTITTPISTDDIKRLYLSIDDLIRQKEF